MLIILIAATQYASAQPAIHFTDSLYAAIKERSASNRFFKHANLMRFVKHDKTNFAIDTLGESVAGRKIIALRIGTGKKKLLIWSQMHGNEPTGTMALLDIINWLQQDSLASAYRKHILSKLSIIILPMLNPDGTAIYKRQNDDYIDINRDAIKNKAPETKLLIALLQKEQASLSISLHDQSIYLGNPQSNLPASISFLTAYPNAKLKSNDARTTSLKAIVWLRNTAEQWLPGQITRYADTYIPSAFEEYCIANNMPMILIETGGMAKDAEKQKLRKLNFRILLAAMGGLANNDWQHQSPEKYYNIPVSKKIGYDILIRNAKWQHCDTSELVDIGIRHHEWHYNNYSQSYRKYYISQIGKLTKAFGYTEINASDLQMEAGKIHKKTLTHPQELTSLNLDSLAFKSITAFRISTYMPESVSNQLPVLYVDKYERLLTGIALMTRPNIVLKNNGRVIHTVVNGTVRSQK